MAKDLRICFSQKDVRTNFVNLKIKILICLYSSEKKWSPTLITVDHME